MDEKIRTALASLTRTEESRRELAEVITEWFQPNHLTTDLISLFLNTRQLKAGDMLVKKLRKPNIRVRKFVPGTVHLADEVEVTSRVNYILDGHVVKLMANLWDLERGDIGTVEDMKREMVGALVDFYAGRVFSLLTTVWDATNTPNNYAEVSGDLTKLALDTAIDYVNYKAGGVRAIVSVKRNLLPITEFAGYGTYATREQFSDPILTEALRDGWIGQYRGVRNIVGLPQMWDNPESDTAMIPEDFVLVIGENAGEFITYGEPVWKEYIDNVPTPPYWICEEYSSWGMVVDYAEGVYVIKLM